MNIGHHTVLLSAYLSLIVCACIINLSLLSPLGIRDADALSSAVLLGLETGQDIGSVQLLRTYESKRYYSNLSMMTIVDTLNTIFSIGKSDPNSPASGTPLSVSGVEKVALFLRSAGMLGVHGLGPFKERIAKLAMGMGKNGK